MGRRATERRLKKGGARHAHFRGLKRGARLRRTLPILIAVALLVSAIAGALLFHNLATSGPPAGPRTAAIVNQLSLTQPSADFIVRARSLLEQAGYAVDYYPADQVTVDFYRELPSHGYDLIVLRVHSARLLEDKQGRPVDEVVLFTSEPFSLTGHREEQEAGRIAKVRYYKGGDPYFGIRAGFVTSSMTGGFEDTTIIMMGCDGLRSINETARAFVLKGAEAFISWNNLVSGSHSDAATERLLQLMLVEGLPTVDAVVQTDAEMGPDPPSGAKLRILTPEG